MRILELIHSFYNIVKVMREECTPNNPSHSPEVFKHLFFKYREALVLEAHSVLHDISEAEDVVQETFIVIWQKNHLANVPPANYRSYLFSAVRNNCLSQQRKLQTAEKKKAHFLESAPMYDTSNQGDAWEVRLRINQAVQDLPEQRRWAFIKAHLDRKSYREVSQEMGLKMETVRSHVKIALRNLRMMLANLK
ncbi:sigma-70 family RNA polymerase sigma factor [Chitinophaga lutea]|uniref:Sigma-70 family RNA polymerase sigma factor n=2 Tax=Chitinophaga lutea TaxID=2488634 RepID=A0A3N4Q9E9_9BACT|nr:sigma-70 family RNA polymerase sigma factor [Chitinophaga lutea]